MRHPAMYAEGEGAEFSTNDTICFATKSINIPETWWHQARSCQNSNLERRNHLFWALAQRLVACLYSSESRPPSPSNTAT